MRYITLIFCFSVVVNSYSQDLKRVKNEQEVPVRYKEKYNVLVSDPSVKHGEFERDYNGRLLEKGQYSNGVKSGVWVYSRKGEILQKIDFDKHQVVFANDPKWSPRIESWFINGDSLIENKTGIHPHLQGGPMKLSVYFVQALRYPADARRSGTQGTVNISATVTDAGELVDEAIVDGPGRGLTEEALRVVKLLPDEWLPPWIDGKPVRTRVVIPVRFKLEY